MNFPPNLDREIMAKLRPIVKDYTEKGYSRDDLMLLLSHVSFELEHEDWKEEP